jgi:hypothetical protein
MKHSRLILSCAVLISVSMVPWIHQSLSEAGEGGGSQCIDCHTNLKKLIRLCWKVEALKPKALKSEETSGEG